MVTILFIWLHPADLYF